VLLNLLSASLELDASFTLVHLLVGLLVVLDDGKKLLKHLGQVGLRGQVVQLESSIDLGLVSFPVSLVLCALHLDLTDLLDLVVVDHQHLAFTVVVHQVGLGVGGIVWLLEANESESIASLAFFKSDILNLSILLEEVVKIVLAPVIWEVLDVKVASFLRCLISDCFSKLLYLALGFLKSMLDHKLHTVAHLTAIKFVDGV